MSTIESIDRRGTDSNKWRDVPEGYIPLPVADMDYATDPIILEAIRHRLEHPVLGYGSATDTLRQTLVRYMADQFGWVIEPDWLVFLPGVEPGFNMALNAFTTPGQTVMQEYPVYKPLRVAPQTWGLQTAAVWQAPDGNGRWTSSHGQLSDAAARSSIMLLCNPQNPTGRVYTRAELEERIALCLEHDLLLISDEIHSGLTLDDRPHIPAASLGKDIEAKSVTLMAASKTWNIAGLKAAFAIVPDADMRARFVGAKMGLVDSVNILGLAAMEAAYSQGEPWRQAVRNRIAKNRNLFHKFLDTHISKAHSTPAEASFLAWMDLSAYDLGQPAASWLRTNVKLLVSPGSDFGESLDSWIRLNFACSEALLTEALERMAIELKNK
ncbi:PatB family C-S lyase [uncultured Cohaesibacter sp.]|uniref:MalY/PatB family protein n=1 Tax=uncultured Cohaesibacter sp. TaxID=1002546 RepID=UPI0029C738D1|nr:PatB family C-S lyase [uncultured Cohaesibacter sp.]